MYPTTYRFAMNCDAGFVSKGNDMVLKIFPQLFVCTRARVLACLYVCGFGLAVVFVYVPLFVCLHAYKWNRKSRACVRRRNDKLKIATKEPLFN